MFTGISHIDKLNHYESFSKTAKNENLSDANQKLVINKKGDGVEFVKRGSTTNRYSEWAWRVLIFPLAIRGLRGLFFGWWNRRNNKAVVEKFIKIVKDLQEENKIDETTAKLIKGDLQKLIDGSRDDKIDEGSALTLALFNEYAGRIDKALRQKNQNTTSTNLQNNASTKEIKSQDSEENKPVFVNLESNENPQVVDDPKPNEIYKLTQSEAENKVVELWKNDDKYNKFATDLLDKRLTQQKTQLAEQVLGAYEIATQDETLTNFNVEKFEKCFNDKAKSFVENAHETYTDEKTLYREDLYLGYLIEKQKVLDLSNKDSTKETRLRKLLTYGPQGKTCQFISPVEDFDLSTDPESEVAKNPFDQVTNKLNKNIKIYKDRKKLGDQLAVDLENLEGLVDSKLAESYKTFLEPKIDGLNKKQASLLSELIKDLLILMKTPTNSNQEERQKLINDFIQKIANLAGGENLKDVKALVYFMKLNQELSACILECLNATEKGTFETKDLLNLLKKREDLIGKPEGNSENTNSNKTLEYLIKNANEQCIELKKIPSLRKVISNEEKISYHKSQKVGTPNKDKVSIGKVSMENVFEKPRFLSSSKRYQISGKTGEEIIKERRTNKALEIPLGLVIGIGDFKRKTTADGDHLIRVNSKGKILDSGVNRKDFKKLLKTKSFEDEKNMINQTYDAMAKLLGFSRTESLMGSFDEINGTTKRKENDFIKKLNLCLELSRLVGRQKLSQEHGHFLVTDYIRSQKNLEIVSGLIELAKKNARMAEVKIDHLMKTPRRATARGVSS